MMPYSVYIVDDEQVARDGIALALERRYQIEAFPSAEAAIGAMARGAPDLILLDVGLPGMNGVEALEKIKRLNPETLVIMITAYEDVKTVVSAMKLGAYDYVVKPLQMDALLVSVRNALETIRMKKEIQDLHERYLKENLPCFIGESNSIQSVMDFIHKVAKAPDTPVLILGETGTGKELIARAIHYKSPNVEGPFVTLNCSAIPKDLIESELFGYEKGAFTGAHVSGKKGLVEQAADGTLFLDEVADLTLEAQAKFLRFLEEGEYYRVGGARKREIRTRVVSATNKDLDRMIEETLFRRDLYYRLAVVKVEVPSLNERSEDIIPIAKHFLIEFSEKFKRSFTGICPQAEAALRGFKWIGNVRELKNLIERGVLLGDGPELTIENLGLDEVCRAETLKALQNETILPALSPSGIDFPSIMKSIEKHYFEEALKIANGNESKAARILQVSRYAFRYRRKKL